MTWFIRFAWMLLVTGFVLTVYGIVFFTTPFGYKSAGIGMTSGALSIVMLITAQFIKNRLSSTRSTNAAKPKK
jgi:hypothetical protein